MNIGNRWAVAGAAGFKTRPDGNHFSLEHNVGSLMKNIAIALIALWLSLFLLLAGNSSTLHDNRQMKNQIAGQQQDRKDVSHKILNCAGDADERRQVKASGNIRMEKSDTIRTGALLRIRVLNHFDRMQQPAGTEAERLQIPARRYLQN